MIYIFFFVLTGGSVWAQDQLVIAAGQLPATDTVWVFTPETYGEGQALPVVYMLHGYSGNYRQWDQIMGAQQYADTYNMLIVCPDGLYNSWYFNSPEQPESQFVDFFFQELVPLIESRYEVDTNNRFITGLSMGGHGAFHLFLQNPGFFKSAGSSSGVLDLRGSSDAYELKTHLGKFQTYQDRWLAFSAMGNMDKLKAAGVELIFDCGTEDVFYESNRVFYEQCLKRKVPVTFISRPGAHNYEYWQLAIRSHFEFFTTKL